MCFTLPCYYFMIPDTLVATESKGAQGYWGDPNAEFNWCELDYLSSNFIAEPFNTFTSILYIISAVFGAYLHNDLSGVGLRFVEKLILFFVALIGVGSTLFHASLLYPMQLLDELPIYWLMLSSSHALFHREDEQDAKHAFVSPGTSAAILCSVGGGLSFILLSTDQASHVHNIARGGMSTTFAIALVYLFYAASLASHETASRLLAAAGTRDNKSDEGEWVKCTQAPVRIFSYAFFLFVSAIICWLLDNFCCPLLLQLPGSLPYPHLHALGNRPQTHKTNYHSGAYLSNSRLNVPIFPVQYAFAGWHLGTAIGLYLMILGIVFHNQVKVAAAQGRAAEIRLCSLKLCGVYVVPYVIAEQSSSKKAS